MKIVSLEEIKNRINNKFPNQPFEIVKYTRVSQQFGLKCLHCNRIRFYSSFNNFIGAKKKNLCDCYTENSNYSRHNALLGEIEEILNNNSSKIQFIKYWYRSDTKKNMVEVKCLHCKQNYSKPFAEFKKNFNCPFCVGKELLNEKAIKSLLPKEYELVSDYINSSTSVLVRHKSCGFIWKAKVKSLYNYIGCPHCNKKISKGERKIVSFLIQNGIDFEKEKIFPWQSNLKRRYDFYIPKFNLICEYNGEQHYKEVPYFKKTLAEQKQIDEEKCLEALERGYNYLIIPYTDFSNIETILTNWFNDYPKGVDSSESKSKASNLDEDIV